MGIVLFASAKAVFAAANNGVHIKSGLGHIRTICLRWAKVKLYENLVNMLTQSKRLYFILMSLNISGIVLAPFDCLLANGCKVIIVHFFSS